MFSISKLTATGPTCTAPTGRNGRHCGHRLRTGRLADGRTCGRPDCQLWLHIDTFASDIPAA